MADGEITASRKKDQLKADRKEEEKERQEITKALPSGGED